MNRCVICLLFVVYIPVYTSARAEAEAGFCEEESCPDSKQRGKESVGQPAKEDTSSKSPPDPAATPVRASGMEWRAHGTNNDDLVSQLKRNGIVKSQRVEDALRKVDRGNYCEISPFVDSPQSIGYGATISAPHMHAHALEMLKDHLFGGAKVLDVGSGVFFICCNNNHFIRFISVIACS